jgi:hypothetical protein
MTIQKYCTVVVDWCNLQVLYDFWGYVQMLLGSSACSTQDWVECSGETMHFHVLSVQLSRTFTDTLQCNFTRSLLVVLTAVFSNLIHLWIILRYKYRQNIVLESQITVYSLHMEPSFTCCLTRGSLSGTAVLWLCVVGRLVSGASIDPTGMRTVSPQILGQYDVPKLRKALNKRHSVMSRRLASWLYQWLVFFVIRNTWAETGNKMADRRAEPE